jgi:hypothetical protein
LRDNTSNEKQNAKVDANAGQSDFHADVLPEAPADWYQ